jgi:hypothetical protein
MRLFKPCAIVHSRAKNTMNMTSNMDSVPFITTSVIGILTLGSTLYANS